MILNMQLARLGVNLSPNRYSRNFPVAAFPGPPVGAINDKAGIRPPPKRSCSFLSYRWRSSYRITSPRRGEVGRGSGRERALMISANHPYSWLNADIEQEGAEEAEFPILPSLFPLRPPVHFSFPTLPKGSFRDFSGWFATVFTSCHLSLGGRAAFKSISLLKFRSSHLSRVRV